MERRQFLDHVDKFAQIVHRAIKESAWRPENYKTAFCWAEYIEKYLEGVDEDQEEVLDQQLGKIRATVCGKNYSSFLISDLKLSCRTLSCSKHLLLRSLLHNPFIEKSVLSQVMGDFLRLGEELEEDVTTTRESAKKTLIGVINRSFHLIHRI